MKAVKPFEQFIKERIVKKQSANKSRAEFLRDSSQNSYSFLQQIIEKVGISDSNANDYIEQCYDLLMKYIRAKMFLEGYNATGYGPH